MTPQVHDKEDVVQVATGTMSSSSLDRYTCIALAGVAAEYVNFGQAEGGMNDVQQLDSLLKALQVQPLPPHRGRPRSVLCQQLTCWGSVDTRTHQA